MSKKVLVTAKVEMGDLEDGSYGEGGVIRGKERMGENGRGIEREERYVSGVREQYG